MTREILKTDAGSMLVGTMPRGCVFCARGSKMVLFVTGLCDSSCFYCPLSNEKSGKDVTFADEMPVNAEDDLFYEAKAISAEGAGVSGGDPLCEIERTIQYISFLRDAFGPDFHMHLYTSKTDINKDVLLELIHAGLDEIRFHPQSTDWSAIETAVSLDIDVGIEVPVLPDRSDHLIALAQRAEDIGVDFLNLNELEASESNFDSIISRGMRLTDMESASIAGSRETAVIVLNWAASNLETLTVHFCSARYKDAVQMRNRLERRLQNTIREFEERDDTDPLLILGVIRAPHGSTMSDEDLLIVHQTLFREFDVPEELMNIDRMRMRIEIAPWIVEKIASEIHESVPFPLEIGVAYEYPSWDRLQTMFSPL